MNQIKAFIYDESINFDDLFRKKEIFNLKLNNGKTYSVKILEKHINGSFTIEVLSNAVEKNSE